MALSLLEEFTSRFDLCKLKIDLVKPILEQNNETTIKKYKLMTPLHQIAKCKDGKEQLETPPERRASISEKKLLPSYYARDTAAEYQQLVVDMDSDSDFDCGTNEIAGSQT